MTECRTQRLLFREQGTREVTAEFDGGWITSDGGGLLLREFGLQGAELAAAQAGTIRTKLLKIGGRLRQSVRRVWISLSESYPYQHLFERILQNLHQQHPRPLRV